jgi:hypothetical protein
MRNLKPLCVAIVLLIGAVKSNAQETAPLSEPNYKKPQLFGSLPDNIKVNIQSLKELLKSSNGEAIASDLGNSGSAFNFNGQIVSTASKYNNTIKSVVIRSSNFNGARLTFTQRTNDDGTVSYIGRIMSFDHADVYELQQKEDGSYAFVKKKLNDIVNE